MKRDSKLSLALHILGHMGAAPDRPLQSEVLAGFHATHPVVVRRTLGQLREAGLVLSAKGHAGGWRLAKPAAAITVADVYRALGEHLDPAPGSGPENPPGCAIERALHGHWNRAVAEAEALLLDRLSRMSIADLSASMTEGPAHPHGQSSGGPTE
ncbi:RrF2 family transcriptional regulator [Tabrizicola sp.]|uniref:RrF2 family transcriptional regulator n=1 Tax=Tabrizicola sp. TaxID=2005166 RepID=UPI002FDE6933